MSDRRRLARALAKLPGVTESDSMFTPETAFWVNGREIAHFEEKHLDIRLTRAEIRVRKDQLAQAVDVVRRRSPSSDWVVVEFTTRPGYALALELAGRAAVVHGAPAGQSPVDPPTGNRLTSLRRFHLPTARTGGSAQRVASR